MVQNLFLQCSGCHSKPDGKHEIQLKMHRNNRKQTYFTFSCMSHQCCHERFPCCIAAWVPVLPFRIECLNALHLSDVCSAQLVVVVVALPFQKHVVKEVVGVSVEELVDD